MPLLATGPWSGDGPVSTVMMLPAADDDTLRATSHIPFATLRSTRSWYSSGSPRRQQRGTEQTGCRCTPARMPDWTL
jgi:hypothetical protein